LLSSAIAALLVVGVLAFLVFAGVRLGVRFLLRRLVGLVFVVLGVTFITFILGYFAPGNAAYTQLGQHYSKEAYDHLTHFYGLDLAGCRQYARAVGPLVLLGLGSS